MAASMSEDKYIDVFHPIARLFPFFIFRHFTFYIGNFSRREYISSFLLPKNSKEVFYETFNESA